MNLLPEYAESAWLELDGDEDFQCPDCRGSGWWGGPYHCWCETCQGCGTLGLRAIMLGCEPADFGLRADANGRVWRERAAP